MFSFFLVVFSHFLYLLVYYHILTLMWCFLGFFLLYTLLRSTSIRYKLFFFFLIIFFFISWGFWFNLDGVMLILLLTELMLVVVFYLVYTQLYCKVVALPIKYTLSPYFFIIVIMFVGSSQLGFSLSWTNFYNSVCSVVSSDFFLIYYFFYVQYPILLGFIVVLLGLFSIFFIFFYFNLKSLVALISDHKRSLYFLRKQNMLRQSNFKVFVRSFKV